MIWDLNAELRDCALFCPCSEILIRIHVLEPTIHWLIIRCIDELHFNLTSHFFISDVCNFSAEVHPVAFSQKSWKVWLDHQVFLRDNRFF